MIERLYIIFIQIIIQFRSIQSDGMEKEINFCVECAVDWFEQRLKSDSFFFFFSFLDDKRCSFSLKNTQGLSILEIVWRQEKIRKKKPLSVVRNSKESISANQTNNLPRSQKQWNVIGLQQQQPLNQNNQIDPFFFRSFFINIFLYLIFNRSFSNMGTEKIA